ncbi:MAG: OmpA family protein [Acidobacteriota bacterium]
MRNLFVVIVVTVLLALWCLYCIQHHAPIVEEQVLNNACAVLDAPSFTAVQTDVDGRDVVLTGSVTSDALRAQAAELAAAAGGVRSVDNQVVVVRGSRIEAAPDGDAYRLTGRVPDEASKSALLLAANENLGTRELIEEIGVDGELGADPSARDLPNALREILQNVKAPGLRLDEEQVLLTGTVPSQSLRTRVETRIAERLPGVAIDNRIEVVERSAASIVEEVAELLELRTIEFENNSAELTDTGVRVLTEVRNTLAQIPETKLEISGHTDSRGSADWNRQLSGLRAEAVLTFLSRTLDAERFSAIGRGSSQPVASNETAEGRQRNRRIAFRILEEN